MKPALAVLLGFALLCAGVGNAAYYQAEPGQGWLQVTNNAGYDLTLVSDAQSRILYLAGSDADGIELPNGGAVTLQMDEAEWMVYGDVDPGLQVTVHSGFTTSLQLAQTAYGGNVGLIGVVDDGRHKRSATLFSVAAPPTVIVQQPSPVVVDPGYYYDGGSYYYDDGYRPGIGGAIVSGIVGGILDNIFDDHRDRYPGHRPRPPDHYNPGRPPYPGPGGPGHGPGRPPERPDSRPPHRPDQPGRPDRPGRPDQPGRPDRPGRPEQPGRPERPGRPEAPRPPERPQHRPESRPQPEVRPHQPQPRPQPDHRGADDGRRRR